MLSSGGEGGWHKVARALVRILFLLTSVIAEVRRHNVVQLVAGVELETIHGAPETL